MGRKPLPKNQVNGRDENSTKAKSLDEIWGFRMSKYKTDNVEIYEKDLSLMNKVDLQAECIRIGLMPKDDRLRMKEELIKQFRQHTAAVKTSSLSPKQLEVKDRQRVKNILSAGGNGFA